MYFGEHVNLLVLFIQQVFQFPHFSLQCPHPILQRLGVSAWKGPPTQLIAGLALESDIGTLGTTWSDTVATNLLAPTPGCPCEFLCRYRVLGCNVDSPIASLRDTSLRTRPDFYDLHWEYAGHLESRSCRALRLPTGFLTSNTRYLG